MLRVEINTIPIEGLQLDEPLDRADLHLGGDEEFGLQPGGRLRCRLEKSDGDSVHVRGRLTAELGLECNRCLSPYSLPIGQELDLFYLPHQAETEDQEEEDEVELDDHDMVVAYHDGRLLDLGEIVREQLVLTTPMKRLCREDCKGRCPHCAADLNGAPCPCPAPETQADPRFAALKKLFPTGSE